MRGPSTIDLYNREGSGERPAGGALILGFLCGDTERYRTADGRLYAEALTKTANERVIEWRLLAFHDGPREELASLKRGDRVAASGAVYRDCCRGDLSGNYYILLIDRLISVARQRGRAKREKAQERREQQRQGPVDSGLDDEVPF